MIRVWTSVRKKGKRTGMSVFLFALATFLANDNAFASGVTGVDVAQNKVVIKFDGAVEKASALVMNNPQRIALDIGGAEKGKNGVASGIVSAIRQAQFDPKTTRIVFDLNRPALFSSGGFSADGKTLTLTLNPVAAPAFESASQRARTVYKSPVLQAAKPPRSRYNLTIPLGGAARGLPMPRVYGPAGRPLVVIDAGHGGHDPGTISTHGGAYEKDVTLKIAQKIKNELVASGRVRVALTREDDKFLVLRERTAIARNLGAQLFISIHADSAGSADAQGATVYTLSEVASDREAEALARRENKADILNGVNLSGENKDVSSILVDLAQRETLNSSSAFANLIKREGAGLIPFRTGFHRMAGLAVLKSPDMPAILFEVGYLTNATDTTRITSAEGQRNIAIGMRKAIEIYFAKKMASR
jgi:N-acetylmuramoyl-L-alanine amidase